MRIAVTGGLGFIGAATVEAGQAAGHEMVALDRGRELRFGEPHPVDILDMAAMRAEVMEVDHVIHLAGVLGTAELFDDPHKAVDVNVHGTLNVLEACRMAGAGYTAITMPPSGWANVYAATKGCAVELAEAWRRHRDLRVSNVCAFNAYGPGQKFGPGHPQKIIPTFARWAWAGEPIQIWGDGEQTVDLVHADEVGRMLIDAVRFGGGQTFDAGTGHAFTVNQVADMVCDLTGSTAPHRYLSMRPGEDAQTEIVARGRGWGLLDWRPTFDQDAFTRCVNSYREGVLSL